jgi:hypothetical protein
MNKATVIIMLAAVTICIAGPRAARAQATSDIQVTLLDLPTVAYYIDSYSPLSADVGSTGSSNLNPTMKLVVGSRYKFTFADGVNHPFQVIAKGANSTLDTVLLAQGPTIGSLEGDSGIAWLESGSDMYFTATLTLVNAMNAGGLVPGYRCEFHPDNMRGSFTIVSGVADWRKY